MYAELQTMDGDTKDIRAREPHWLAHGGRVEQSCFAGREVHPVLDLRHM